MEPSEDGVRLFGDVYMPKKLTKDIIRKKLKEYNLELISDYKNLASPITVKCRCGKVFTRVVKVVFDGYAKSCGCLKRNLLSIRSSAILENKAFGYLTVVKRIGSDKHRKVIWECKCKCGKICEVTTGQLVSGKTTSCGCYHKETCGRFSGYKEISGAYWGSVKDAATRREIEFDLPIENAWDLFVHQDRKCSLSGVELSFARNYKKDIVKQTASLDRINSAKGYTIDNVQWIHKTLNKVKWTLSNEELLDWIIKIYKHRIENYELP